MRCPNKTTPTHSTRINQPSSELNAISFMPYPHPSYPSASSLNKETCTSHVAPIYEDPILDTMTDDFLKKPYNYKSPSRKTRPSIITLFCYDLPSTTAVKSIFLNTLTNFLAPIEGTFKTHVSPV